jgi:hypothetical protein
LQEHFDRLQAHAVNFQVNNETFMDKWKLTADYETTWPTPEDLSQVFATMTDKPEKGKYPSTDGSRALQRLQKKDNTSSMADLGSGVGQMAAASFNNNEIRKDELAWKMKQKLKN